MPLPDSPSQQTGGYRRKADMLGHGRNTRIKYTTYSPYDNRMWPESAARLLENSNRPISSRSITAVAGLVTTDSIVIEFGATPSSPYVSVASLPTQWDVDISWELETVSVTGTPDAVEYKIFLSIDGNEFPCVNPETVPPFTVPATIGGTHSPTSARRFNPDPTTLGAPNGGAFTNVYMVVRSIHVEDDGDILATSGLFDLNLPPQNNLPVTLGSVTLTVSQQWWQAVTIDFACTDTILAGEIDGRYELNFYVDGVLVPEISPVYFTTLSSGVLHNHVLTTSLSGLDYGTSYDFAVTVVRISVGNGDYSQSVFDNRGTPEQHATLQTPTANMDIDATLPLIVDVIGVIDYGEYSKNLTPVIDMLTTSGGKVETKVTMEEVEIANPTVLVPAGESEVITKSATGSDQWDVFRHIYTEFNLFTQGKRFRARRIVEHVAQDTTRTEIVAEAVLPYKPIVAVDYEEYLDTAAEIDGSGVTTDFVYNATESTNTGGTAGVSVVVTGSGGPYLESLGDNAAGMLVIDMAPTGAPGDFTRWMPLYDRGVTITLDVEFPATGNFFSQDVLDYPLVTVGPIPTADYPVSGWNVGLYADGTGAFYSIKGTAMFYDAVGNEGGTGVPTQLFAAQSTGRSISDIGIGGRHVYQWRYKYIPGLDPYPRCRLYVDDMYISENQCHENAADFFTHKYIDPASGGLRVKFGNAGYKLHQMSVVRTPIEPTMDVHVAAPEYTISAVTSTSYTLTIDAIHTNDPTAQYVIWLQDYTDAGNIITESFVGTHSENDINTTPISVNITGIAEINAPRTFRLLFRPESWVLAGVTTYAGEFDFTEKMIWVSAMTASTSAVGTDGSYNILVDSFTGYLDQVYTLEFYITGGRLAQLLTATYHPSVDGTSGIVIKAIDRDTEHSWFGGQAHPSPQLVDITVKESGGAAQDFGTLVTDLASPAIPALIDINSLQFTAVPITSTSYKFTVTGLTAYDNTRSFDLRLVDDTDSQFFDASSTTMANLPVVITATGISLSTAQQRAATLRVRPTTGGWGFVDANLDITDIVVDMPTVNSVTFAIANQTINGYDINISGFDGMTHPDLVSPAYTFKLYIHLQGEPSELVWTTASWNTETELPLPKTLLSPDRDTHSSWFDKTAQTHEIYAEMWYSHDFVDYDIIMPKSLVATTEPIPAITASGSLSIANQTNVAFDIQLNTFSANTSDTFTVDIDIKRSGEPDSKYTETGIPISTATSLPYTLYSPDRIDADADWWSGSILDHTFTVDLTIKHGADIIAMYPANVTTATIKPALIWRFKDDSSSLTDRDGHNIAWAAEGGTSLAFDTTKMTATGINPELKILNTDFALSDKIVALGLHRNVRFSIKMAADTDASNSVFDFQGVDPNDTSGWKSRYFGLQMYADGLTFKAFRAVGTWVGTGTPIQPGDYNFLINQGDHKGGANLVKADFETMREYTLDFRGKADTTTPSVDDGWVFHDLVQQQGPFATYSGNNYTRQDEGTHLTGASAQYGANQHQNYLSMKWALTGGTIEHIYIVPVDSWES